jgi:hypothetical protein
VRLRDFTRGKGAPLPAFRHAGVIRSRQTQHRGRPDDQGCVQSFSEALGRPIVMPWTT